MKRSTALAICMEYSMPVSVQTMIPLTDNDLRGLILASFFHSVDFILAWVYHWLVVNLGAAQVVLLEGIISFHDSSNWGGAAQVVLSEEITLIDG